MLKKLFKYFIKKHSAKEQIISPDDMQGAQKIFFAVFSRYGDGIISFKVIREFAALYPDKQYLLFTTSQLVPYAKEILNDGVEVAGVNKRNPLSLIPSILKLKNFDADLGFNPWSHGDDAEFFVSFAKKFISYKKVSKHPKEYNVYDRVREYLLMPVKTQKTVYDNFDISGVKSIVIAPVSTDVKKNLSVDDINKLIAWLKTDNKTVKITIAAPASPRIAEHENVRFFIFGKSLKKSNEFLSLLKHCDLFVGVDSGPLHLALCLGKKCVGVFGSNAPETIIDDGFSMISYRHPALNGVFCFVKSCNDAKCIHSMFDGNIFEFESSVAGSMRLEEAVCPLLCPKEIV